VTFGRALAERGRLLPQAGSAFLLAVAIALSQPLSATNFTVDSLADFNDAAPGDGFCLIGPGGGCTLRAAVEETNALTGPDKITLPAGRYTLTIPGIGNDDASMGDLDVTDDLTIEGDGADQTIVDGGGLDRAFHALGSTASLELKRLTVTGGETLTTSDPPAGLGGGVLVESGATSTLLESRIAGNRAIAGGGVAAWHSGTVHILSSEVTRNEIHLAPGYVNAGGGIYFNNPFSDTARIVIEFSTISHNGCSTQPAADCVGGATIPNCGDPPAGGLIMDNVTVSGNEGQGFAIGNCDSVVANTTFYNNSGYGLVDDFGATCLVRNSIFAHNGIQDCDVVAGVWQISGQHNLSSDSSCDLDATAGDLVNDDPELHRLGLYTPPPPLIALSHHPRRGSPVVDAGLVHVTQSDQDGYPRLQDGDGSGTAEYDMGSIEVVACGTFEDFPFGNITLTSGTLETCYTITAFPNVIIDGSVTFKTRETVGLGEGFLVTSGSTFTVELVRDAGEP
jgi:CSLREA domain-containing protein